MKQKKLIILLSIICLISIVWLTKPGNTLSNLGFYYLTLPSAVIAAVTTLFYPFRVNAANHLYVVYLSSFYLFVLIMIINFNFKLF